MENSTDLNKIYADKLLLNIIWMYVCLVTGTVGNALVLLVYGLCMKTKRGNERYFIPILAFWDLLASILASLHGLFDYSFHINYPSNNLCRFLNFGSMFTSGISALTLLLIAIQRYRKICVPQGKQMDSFWKRTSLAVTFVFILIYSLPMCFTAGLVDSNKHLNVNLTNETVFSCSLDAGDSSLHVQIYLYGIAVIVFSNIVAVTVLYSLIACSIYKHSSRRHSSSGGTRLPRAILQKDDSKSKHPRQALEPGLGENQASIDSFKPAFQDNDVTSVERNQVNKSESDRPSDAKPEHRDNDFSEADGNEKNVSTRTFQRERNNSKAKKWKRTKVNFNLMVGTIVILYILAFAPTLLMFVVPSDFKIHYITVYEFFNNLYIVNHIVNPFVYGYFDFLFRDTLKSIINCKRPTIT